ncbi:MAG: methyltransferase domain-containing protein [Candidatus Auribacterota bacterium]|jgi:SAM-dependent methyltransferase|nr:methyltransferase domain-containing protein [Candidatus Auribacterota bacterium]
MLNELRHHLRFFHNIIGMLILFSVFCIAFVPYSFTAETTFCAVSTDKATVHEKIFFDKDTVIYHIQDAHCHPQAQFAIADILAQLLEKHPQAIVSIEGATGTIKPDNLRNFPDKNAIGNVSEYFVNSGLISGAEYYYLTAPEPFTFIGVENPDTYRQNYKIILSALDNHAPAATLTENLIIKINEIANRNFTPEQAAFYSAWQKYHRGNSSLESYATYLAQIVVLSDYPQMEAFLNLCAREKSIRFNTVEQQRLAFLDWATKNTTPDLVTELFKTDIQYKLHKISIDQYFKLIGDCMVRFEPDLPADQFSDLRTYISLIEESKSIDKSALHAELSSSADRLAKTVFSDTTSESLFEICRYAQYYSDLLSLAIDNTALRQMDDNHNLDWFIDRLAVYGIVVNEIDILRQATGRARLFYEWAHKRDTDMVTNLLEAMASAETSVGIIITGGFHRDGICEHLRRQRISYCSLAPVMHGAATETNYFSLISNRSTPLEKWLRGSTLAIASWLADTPLVNEELKQIRTTLFSSILVSSHIKSMSISERSLLESNITAFIDRINSTLLDWQISFTPMIEINSTEYLDSMLVVSLSVRGRELVFVYTSSDQQDIHGVGQQDILEKTRIGNDTVHIVTTDIYARLIELVKADKASKIEVSAGTAQRISQTLGLSEQFRSGTLTMPVIMEAFRTYNFHNNSDLSLKDFYVLIQYTAIVQPEIRPSENHAAVNTADLFSIAYNLLRRAGEGDAVIDIATLDQPWRNILLDRGIRMILIDPAFPFEAIVNALSVIIFTDIETPGIIPIGQEGTRKYQTRISTLTDGSYLVRISAVSPTQQQRLFWSIPERLGNETQLPLPFKSGVVTVEIDGSFTISSIMTYTPQSKTLEQTDLTTSINGMSRGNIGAQQLMELVKHINILAMKNGIVLRGFVYLDQETSPMFFGSLDQMLDHYKATHDTTYIPPRQTNWANVAGNMSEADIFRIANSNNISYSDEALGYQVYKTIERYTSLMGKNILEVGSQSGHNVFYTYLKGAELSVGIDFNPYSLAISREIAAYINEQTHLQYSSFPKTLSQYILGEQETHLGEPFFRLLELKDQEEATGIRLSHKPPENIELAIGDARVMHYPDDSFDILNSINVLAYIDNAAMAVKEMIRVSKTGGLIQFNYRFKRSDCLDLLEDAVRMIAQENGVQVEYSVVEESCGLFLGTDAMLIKIISKTPLRHIDDQKTSFNHIFSIWKIKNNFDALPYLQRIHSPIDIFPEELSILSSMSLDSLEKISGLPATSKFNILLAVNVIKKQYGADIFDGISVVQIRSDLEVFAEVADGILKLHPAVLSNPHFLVAQIQLAILQSKISALPAESYPFENTTQEKTELYTAATSLYMTVKSLRGSLSHRQYQDLIDRLALTADTDIARNTLEFGELLRETKIEYTEEQHIQVIAKFLYRMPQYKHLRPLLLDASQKIAKGEVTPVFMAELTVAADHIMDTLQMSPGFYRELGTISPLMLNKLAASRNSATAIAALLDFLPWRERVKTANRPIPENVSTLLADDSIISIFENYPNTGFTIMTELCKAALSNPLYPSDSPFLLYFSSVELRSIMSQIESINDQQPELLNTLLAEAQSAVSFTGIKQLKTALLDPSPIEALQRIDRTQPVGEEISSQNTAWMNFLQYYEKLTQSPDVIPDNLRSIFTIDTLDAIYKDYSQTGFYVLTELAKSLINNPDDPAEVAFLKNLSSSDILDIIKNIHGFITARPSTLQRQGLHGIAYAPADAWIGPQMHRTLLELNEKAQYHTIMLNTNLGIETVEAAQELYREFTWEVMRLNIKPDDIVVLKLYDSETTEDETTLHTLIVIADRLHAINSINALTDIRMSSGSQLGQYLFCFKTHFMPSEQEMGDIVGGSDWHISFRDDFIKNRGLGSEFLHNHFSLLRMMGLHGITDRTTAHGIPIMSIINNEIGSVFIDELLNDAPVGSEWSIMDYSHLLYRLGIFNDDDLDFAYETLGDNDPARLKERISSKLSLYKKPQETYLNLIVRTARATVDKLVHLHQIVTIYSTMTKDPMVIQHVPEILQSYEPVAQYIEMKLKSDSFLSDRTSLRLERSLLDNLDSMQQELISYMQGDDRILARYNRLFESQPDASQIFVDFNDYFENAFTYTRMKGELPARIPPSVIPYSAQTILYRAQKLTGAFNAGFIRDTLLAENPYRTVSRELVTLEHIQQLRWALYTMGRRILRDTAPSLIEESFLMIRDKMRIARLPVDKIFKNKQNHPQTMMKHPAGTYRLFAYLTRHGFFQPEQIEESVNHISKMSTDDFTSLLSLLDDKQTAKQLLGSLPTASDMIRFGIMFELEQMRANSDLFGKINILGEDNTRIIAHPSNPNLFAIDGASTDTTGYKGANSYETAKFVRSLFAKHNLKSSIILGKRQGMNREEYFVRAGNLIIGTAPYSPMFIDRLDYEEDITAKKTDERPAFINEQLYFEPRSADNSILYTAGLQLQSVQDKLYLDCTITANRYPKSLNEGSDTYSLRIPVEQLLEFLSYLQRSFVIDIPDICQNMPEVYFGLTESTSQQPVNKDDMALISDLFNDIIQNIDSLWIINQRRQSVLKDAPNMTSNQLSGIIEILPFAEAMPQTAEYFIDLQYKHLQKTGNPATIDQIRRTLQDKPDINIITIRGVPVGWIESDGTQVIDLSIPNNLKSILHEALTQTSQPISPFIARQPATSLAHVFSLMLNESQEWKPILSAQFEATSLPVLPYSRHIDHALTQIDIPKTFVAEKSITFKVVDGQSYFASMQILPDGSQTAVMDIDLFKHPQLLALALRHVLEQHTSETPLQTTAGELQRLIADFIYLENLHPDEFNQILTLLKEESVGLANLAVLYETAIDKTPLERFSLALDFIHTAPQYGRLQAMLGDMPLSAITDYIVQDILPETATVLIEQGLDQHTVAAAVTHPEGKHLMSFFNLLSYFSGKSYEVSVTPVVIALDFLNQTKDGLAQLALLFHTGFEKEDQNIYTFSEYGHVWARLFSLYGIDSIAALLEQSGAQSQRITSFHILLQYLTDHFGPRYSFEFNLHAKPPGIHVQQQLNDKTVSLTYDLNGKVIAEKQINTLPYDVAIHQLVIDQANLSELYFGKEIDRFIELLEIMLTSDDPEVFAKTLEECATLNKKAMDLYYTHPRIDVSIVAVNKQAAAKSIIYQFASDLLGSPLSALSMAIQLIELDFKGSVTDKVKLYSQKALDNALSIRNNMIRFRMINSYIMSAQSNPMILFSETMKLEENKPFANLEAATVRDISETMEKHIEAAGNTDWFVLYISEDPAAAVAWLYTIIASHKTMPANIAVISPAYRSTILEDLFSKADIDHSSFLILGSEYFIDSKEISADTLISLVKANSMATSDQLIFMTADTDMFANFADKGIHVMPLPGIIHNIPTPQLKRVINYKLYDEAA